MQIKGFTFVLIVTGLVASSGTATATPTLLTYTNAQAGFSIQYSRDLRVVTAPKLSDTSCNYVGKDMKPVVRFEMPDANHGNDEDILGGLDICMGHSDTANNDCLTIDDPNESGDSITDVGLTRIHGINFLTSSFNQAAAGNRLSITSYSALSDDIGDIYPNAQVTPHICYKLNVVVSGNGFSIGPDLNPQKSRDEAKQYNLPFSVYDAFAELTPLVKTFQFIH